MDSKERIQREYADDLTIVGDRKEETTIMKKGEMSDRLGI